MAVKKAHLRPPTRAQVISEFDGGLPEIPIIMNFHKTRKPKEANAWDDMENIPKIDPDALHVKEVSRVILEKTQQTYDESEKLKFELITDSHGNTNEVIIDRHPDESNPSKGVINTSTDLSDASSPEEAEAKLTALNNLVIDNEIKFHPKGQVLDFHCSFPPEWTQLGQMLIKNQLAKRFGECLNAGIPDVCLHFQDGSTCRMSNLVSQKALGSAENTEAKRRLPRAFDPRAIPRDPYK